MTLRRAISRFLLGSWILSLCAAGQAAGAGWLMYVGTYTSGSSKGIYAYRFQTESGKLTSIGTVAEAANPSFLAIHPNHRFLYAVNEINQYEGQEAGSVSGYAIDSVTGALTLLGRVSTRGTGPCHLALDRTGTWLFVANYDGGSIAAFPVGKDGALGQASAFFQHSGSSIDPLQAGPHAHVTTVSPDNRHAFVADLGLDQILKYRVDSAAGLVPGNPPFTKVAAGSGPRHLAFSVDSKFLFSLNELASTVTALRYDSGSGGLLELQTVKTLPDDFKGSNSAAEIEVHPSGKFLYASNRGHDSIAVFAIDTAKGTLTAAGHVSTQGKNPRSFALDPTGSFLLAANQDSANVVVFRVDRNTGALTSTGDTLEVPFPVSIVFAATAPAARPKSVEALSAAPARGEEIALWPRGAPGFEGLSAPELSKASTNANYRGLPSNFTITHYPSVYAFLPPKDKANGAAMIVAPGGGHTQVVIEKEGWEIADWLNSNGIAAFVLKYRLARAPGSAYTLPEHVYADAARSVRLVRSQAAPWGLDPKRIGFIGFSAGGEIAGMIGTRFDRGNPADVDPIERAGSRPDFNVLIYPSYRPGARSDAAPLFPIPSDAPPVFMVCADDDRSHVEPTVKFYLELEAKKIPAEMHIYATGGHGFALRPASKTAPVNTWPERFKEWLVSRGIR